MGRITKRKEQTPGVEREVAVFHRTLRRNKQVVPAGTPLTPGATHVERKTSQGSVVLERKRFSAI